VNPILSAGVLIGILCGIWTFVMGFTGWYHDPRMMNAIYLVIPIEFAGLRWGLQKTALEGRTYGGQVIAGTLMTVVAGVIIACASLAFTFVFPDYFTGADAIDTPMGKAMEGFMTTLVAGILASAIIAVFVRAKRRAPTSIA
jgi:hypothetical protein